MKMSLYVIICVLHTIMIVFIIDSLNVGKLRIMVELHGHLGVLFSIMEETSFLSIIHCQLQHLNLGVR